ncbi:MAG TPA: hypothetical protein DCY59_07330 [Micrococcaceae bacterium]|nr:hypothetical protein [Micrococcaceae bacterium]
MEAVTTLLVGVVSGQGGGAVATNALAPYIANLIGNKFDEKHGSDPNAAAQLLSHALLGALLAEVNGGNAAGGAAAAAGGELAAKLLTEALYPGHTGELDGTQKEAILALSQAVGALAGGIGNGVSGAALGSDIAGNAIENNYLSAPQRKAKDTERAECNGNMACLEAVDVRWAEVSQDQSRKVKDSYWSYLTPEEQFVLFSMKPGTKEYDSLLARGLAGSLDLGKPVPELYQHVLRLLTETDWVGPQARAPRGGLTLDSRNQIEIALLGPIFGLPGGVTTMAGGTPEQVAGANQFGAVAMDLAGSAQVLRPKNVVGSGTLSGQTDSYIQSTLTEYNVAFPSRYISGDMRIGNNIPSSVVFNSNIERHISTVDGFTQRSGVAGGHNLQEFASFASNNGLQILGGPVQRSGGIYTIAYKIPAYDRAGSQIGYKEETYYKTVYDPAYFSDVQIYNLGRTAAEGGYLKARSEGKFQYDASAGGVSFRVYLDKVTGAVTNFHPK